MNKGPPRRLCERTFAGALDDLVDRDADLARVVETWGPPPMWRREPGFGTLLLIILEQQVSLASAKAAYNRLLEAVSSLTPAAFLKLDDRSLKKIGFSRQKTRYGRALAHALDDGTLDLGGLDALPDDAARTALTKLPGIGPWTADCYLLMALLRPDVWPTGDLALASAALGVKRLRKLPGPDRLLEIGRPWRPWRAVAARVLWHHYLSEKAAAAGSRR